jgi:hypothetical protein
VSREKLKYMKDNWKLLVHILFTTKRFGVNNKWWSSFDSLFGIPWYKRTPLRLIWNYKMAKFRATKCHFISKETEIMLFGKNGK